jgi:hypothetical protein
VEADLPVGLAPDQADRQAAAQLAAGGLVLDAAFQPGPQDMQLSFLCGPRRYADQAAGAGGGERSQMPVFGMILGAVWRIFSAPDRRGGNHDSNDQAVVGCDPWAAGAVGRWFPG